LIRFFDEVSFKQGGTQAFSLLRLNAPAQRGRRTGGTEMEAVAGKVKDKSRSREVAISNRACRRGQDGPVQAGAASERAGR